MAAEDVAITAAVRRVLTGRWIDITQVRVRSTRGVVHLAGNLCRMTADHATLTEANLRDLNLAIRAIHGVRSVYYDFDNWKRDKLGGWQRGAPPGGPAAPAFSLDPEQPPAT